MEMDEMGEDEMGEGMPSQQQAQDPEDIVIGIVTDPQFMDGLQKARESMVDLPTAFSWALSQVLAGVQRSLNLDDDVVLDQIAPKAITAMLAIAQKGGDDEATPDMLKPVWDDVIRMLGRADAEAEMEEGTPMPENEQGPPPAKPGNMSAMLGAA